MSPGVPDDQDLAARLEAREAQLQRMRSGLSEGKRAALERRLRGAASGTAGEQTAQPAVPSIPRRPARTAAGDADAADIEPTSFAQERLWFLAQLDPDSLAYSLPAAVRLDGALDLPALRHALAAVVRRHESLRTTFANRGGQPVQRIAPPGVTELPVVDLGGIEPRDAEARRLTREAAQRPFDLAAGPLFAPLLLRESATRATLVLTVHHIVTDAWSMGVLVRELAAVYGGSTAGTPAVLPELPIQYADYARWQRGWLTGAVLEEELAYWRERLAGLSPVLELPADRPRPAMASGRGGRRAWHASAGVTARLRSLTQEGGATLFMLLLAVFEALLGRLAGENDVAVGVPVAGRTRVETEGLIGFFVNTLVLRLDLSGAPDLRTLLARSREATLGAFAHQEIPFERLVTELRPERAAARNPLFQIGFVLQNAPAEPLRLPGLTLASAPAATGGALFDLTLEAVEVPDGLTGYLEYSHDLFDGTTASRLARCFMTFLAAAAADPERRFDDLPWLAEVERHQVLHEWNGGRSPYPRSATIHGLFLEWARRKPDAIALTAAGSTDEDLSYAALAAHAGRLARRLRAWGVEPETPVALCLGRSPRLIIALLAILEAGGAYLPLDPAYPRERLALMLGDLRRDRGGRAPLLLTEERFAGLFTWFAEAGGRLVRLDRSPEDEPEDEKPVPPLDPEIDPEVDPENLAYIFYTSGSTGRPKGVAVHHRGVIRLVRDTVYARFAPDEVFLHLSTISFDISTFEIWGALLNGGRLVLMPPETPTLEVLAAVLARQRVSTFLITPALLHQMIDDNLAGLSTLRQLVAGGDVLSPPHIRRLLAAYPGIRVVNGYGPTENTVLTTGGPLPVGVGAAALPPGAGVPIGRPINNTDAFVVCGEDRTEPFAPLAPIGVTGELITGGDGLARGYWQRPELTAERFRPHPFAERPGERVYHTGDRVRALADGRLDFLGRLDRQVKVRGFRIEPAEVEAALAGHPEIREAVVVAAPEPGAGGGKRLIAYLVPREPAARLPAGLRAWLRQRLPEHMVPQSFVALAELPVTAHGKIDRAALPSPESLDAGSEADAEAPRSQEEELLAGIWAEVLGRERIGLRDDFFDLGGHSLLATRVVSRIREVFGIELPLRRLFEAPTVAALAAELAAARRQAEGGHAAAPPAPPIPGARDRELPLSFAQERLWFLDQLEPGGTAYNLALPVALHGQLLPAALAAAVAAVESRHETLRTRFPERGGQAHQEIAPAGDAAALPLVDLAVLPEPLRESERGRLVAALAAHRFDLARGPLVRWTLLRVDPENHVFIIAQHHIITDGWSLGVLVRELASLYTAFAAGDSSPLPPPPLQYADYAVWQHELLAAGGFAPQLAYWRERLGGELPALELPTDHLRTPGASRRGGGATLELPPAPAARVTAASRRAGATPFMTFVAAWKALLHRLSGQDDLLAGVPIAGRNRGEIESTLGFFINTVVLRTHLGGNPPFAALLAQVRETALGAYANQDLPFEHLVAALQPERDLDRTPLFQVFFNHLNLAANPISLPGLTLAPVVSQPPSSKFDLTVYVSEGAGGFRFDVLYDAGLFDAVRIEEMLAQLEQLLTAVLAEPDLAVGIDDVSLITPRATALLPDPAQALAGGWLGGMAGDGGDGAPIHELFARQARISPAHPAVVDADGVWTYGALDAAANRLAHRLVAEGLGPGDVVAIAAERRAALAWAVLGVLKAGCAFLLLDPEYPAARRAAMVRLGGARTVVPLDASADAHDPNNPNDPGTPRVSVGPDDPAYVAFTSGSTGEPKAILGTHAPLTHFAAWHAATFGLTRDDRFSLLSGLSHDPLLRDLLVPLALGATVCAPPPESLGVPEKLLGWMTAERVTVAHLTPSYGQLLAPHPLTPSPIPLPPPGRGGNRALKNLRFVFLGGDRLTAADVARLRGLAPEARVVSFYGATETPQAMGWFEVHEETGVVPLGRGIDSVQLLVCTPRNGWAGIGELGEVVVRTPFLTRGYLGDAALTGERFLPDATANSRIYRTGDLGRYRPDGCVEPAGRADRQIKLRGFRVEPAEIETTLAAEPGVAEAAVVFCEGELVAFVVPRGPALPDLRRSLALRLPSYLVPASIVTLDRLPLTPNRKIDRHALLRRVPEASDRTANGYIAPRDPIEEMIAGIWAEVLGPRRTGGRVGVHDSFFALGGHSLLATQVLSRLRQAFAVEMPLRSLFETPTVAGLAAAVRALRTAGAPGIAEPPLVPISRSEPLPLSFAQESLWVFEQLAPGTATYNMPVALRLLGPARPDVLAAGLEEITRRQESLRTTFVSSGAGPVQVIAPSPLAAPLLPLIDLTALAPDRREKTARQLAAAEAARPFELTRGPLWRSRLLRLAADDHALLLTAHHIICDGWSIGVLATELSALYTSFTAGRPSPLPELAVQYADYAVWQRRGLGDSAFAAQLAWWRSRLDGAPALLELPTDRPRPAHRAHRGARIGWELPAEAASALTAAARRHGATPFMLLLAAFDALLCRHSGQDDLVVGLSIAHRNRVEIEPLIGFFVNMLALRADLQGDPPFRRLLEQARDTALGALDHQDVPFERLVAELRPERGAAHPLFQVLCTLQNMPLTMRLPGLTLAPFGEGSQAAHFDLTLSLATGGDDVIAGYLEYDAELFDATTAHRLVAHFAALLAAVAAEPDLRLSELPVLGVGEQQQLREWNDTAAAFPADRCLHELIAEQAGRTPEALAIAGTESLTFAALDDAADRLATRLRALGLGPDVVAVLYLERSAALAVALLAVLKAGGAYLPLDLADPRERIAWVLQDASPRLILTRSGLVPRLPKQRAETVFLDVPDAEAEKRPHPRPLSQLPPTPPPGEGRQAETGTNALAGLPSPGDRAGGAGRG
ncbi:MAG TPA: amino acid adenylation domain-containing protein, partial [Thermoanaerobaculia bacterium]|nr:amino acid adenylation domain-containing protein [Thermoanaerobaculia bacterium]